jgi:hypothetical protein
MSSKDPETINRAFKMVREAKEAISKGQQRARKLQR